MRLTTYTVWTLRIAVSIFVALPSSFGSDHEAEHKGLLVLTRYKAYKRRVSKIDLETGEETAIIDELSKSTSTAMGYDFGKRVLVLSDSDEKCLYKVNINTGKKEILATGTRPQRLAVDWIHGNVYWTDAATSTISIVSLDGKLRKVLIDTDLKSPSAIIVSPLDGWMFWIDFHTTINRSGMDGTQRSIIVTTGGLTFDLALDFDFKRIYWMNYKQQMLCSSDYDGSNVKMIPLSTPTFWLPFSLDLFEDWIFWADFYNEKVYKANKLTDESTEIVFSRFETRPIGIRFLHSSKQPKGINYCEVNGECSHFCLPAPRITKDSKNFTCACPDGMSLTEDQKNCRRKSPSSTSPAYSCY